MEGVSLTLMTEPISIEGLPGNAIARRFEGREHGANVSLFIGSFPPGSGPKLHRHPYDETFLVEDGSATFTVGGETVELSGGQILVAAAGVQHKFVATGDRPLRMVSIHASGEMIQEWLDR